ncbi:MAG TPA: excinuclease ABC subunit UvrC [Candidatus Coproplasma excrementipullorum]|nr:excinuclease ABC subunit UvrC [Candidatus Coproplasma excrementipullorum]
MDVIKEKLKLLPDSPGVYIMLDKYGNVIYVGKARVLKNRVRQYFHNTPKPEKVMQMVANIADFNYVITNTEIDALALENNLIKKYKPKYNILLKDDKTYPYIKVDMREDFPSFYVTRRIKKDGGRYFGPFMGGINYRDILDVVQLLFGVRLCRTAITAKPRRECLNYHIGRCAAPCAHKITKEEYAERVKKALSFLDGNYKGAQAILEQKMMAAAEAEAFELAMDYKSKIAMLSKLEAKRITSINKSIDADIIAYATNNLYSAVNVLVTRKGIMQGASSFALDEAHLTDGEALTSFITQYYTAHEAPPELIVPEYCEKDLVLSFFKEKLGKTVEITAAKQGVKAELLKMAERNARDYLEKSVDKIKHRDDMTVNACKRLQEQLGLKRYPRRMECYDISNVSGVDKVASMVVFIDGEADRNQYRRFKIKTVEGANDFASLQEVLNRRLSKLGTDEEERFPKPDLIVIDGGKGQLSAVAEIFNQMGVNDIELISIAKQEEEIFTLSSPESVKIPRRDYSLRMVQRIRDEAHRFAITYFRNLHSKNILKSELEKIEGVGKQRRIALMDKFSTIDKIMSASAEEIARTPGISLKVARAIKDYFSN